VAVCDGGHGRFVGTPRETGGQPSAVSQTVAGSAARMVRASARPSCFQARTRLETAWRVTLPLARAAASSLSLAINTPSRSKRTVYCSPYQARSFRSRSDSCIRRWPTPHSTSSWPGRPDTTLLVAPESVTPAPCL
jgi:hypothetical protein